MSADLYAVMDRSENGLPASKPIVRNVRESVRLAVAHTSGQDQRSVELWVTSRGLWSLSERDDRGNLKVLLKGDISERPQA
jgi:hypothetical protein